MIEIKVNQNKSCSSACKGRPERVIWDIYQAEAMLYDIAIARLGEQAADKVMHDIADKLRNGIIKKEFAVEGADAEN